MAGRKQHVLGILLPVLAGGISFAHPAQAPAQETTSRTPVDSLRVVAIGFSLGTHDLGLLLGARITPWLSGAARLEGTGVASRRIIGIGPRVDPVADRYVRVYVLPLFGGVACSPGFFGNAASCIDRALHAAVGLMGGAEFYLNEGGSLSIGVEGGYWWVFESDDDARHGLSHPTVAALLRIRP